MDAPRFTQARTILSLTCRAEIQIGAAPRALWALLTDAARYPEWNSMISGIEGAIEEGDACGSMFQARTSSSPPLCPTSCHPADGLDRRSLAPLQGDQVVRPHVPAGWNQ
jgi:hypothetical protein